MEGKLWESNRYWHCHLAVNRHDINSVSNLYSIKEKAVRKEDYVMFASLCSFNIALILRYLATTVI